FKVVLVIGGEMGVNTRILEKFWHGIVEWFEWPPTAVQKIVASGMEVTACRHTGHAADIGVLKGDGAPGKASKVGRMRPVAAVWWEHVPVERVEHDHDGFHDVRS